MMYIIAPGVLADLCDDCWLRPIEVRGLRSLARQLQTSPLSEDDERRYITHDEYIEACGGICAAHTDGKAPRVHVAGCTCDK